MSVTVQELAKLVKAALFDRSDGTATPGTHQGLSTKVATKILDEYDLTPRTD